MPRVGSARRSATCSPKPLSSGSENGRLVERRDESGGETQAAWLLFPILIVASLAVLAGHETPRTLVAFLVRVSVAATDSELPDIDPLRECVVALDGQARQLDDADTVLDTLLLSRMTPLDYSRPARHLLTDLHAGIRGCCLVWQATSIDEPDLNEDPETRDADDERFDRLVRAGSS